MLGWILYAASWVTPNLEGSQIGARAFVTALSAALRLLAYGRSLAAGVLGLCLLIGWLANFSLFLRWPARARIAWMVAPWAPFIALFYSPLPSPIALLYFYPWAIGIALIHGARLKCQPVCAEHTSNANLH